MANKIIESGEKNQEENNAKEISKRLGKLEKRIKIDKFVMKGKE